MYINALSGMRIPTGATADRPAAPIAGTVRFNTTTSAMEYYTGAAWVRSGAIIQQVQGTISTSSSNVQMPYDNTTPTATEGQQLMSVSFTPVLSNSIIVVTVDGFYAVNSANDVFVSGALYNGTTAIAAQMLGFTTNTGAGANYSFRNFHTSGSTNARTYSFRAGPNSNVTVFYNQGTSGQAFGGVSAGTYIIQEIAP
jgi:hypothetical protein